MSSNLELVRGIYEKWAVGDYSDASWAAEDIEFVQADGTRGTGRDYLAHAWREFLEAWEFFSAVPHAWAEAGDDVLVVARFGGRSKAGGVRAASFEGGSRFTVRDGQVVAIQLYGSPAEALTALGLERSNLTSWF